MTSNLCQNVTECLIGVCCTGYEIESLSECNRVFDWCILSEYDYKSLPECNKVFDWSILSEYDYKSLPECNKSV